MRTSISLSVFLFLLSSSLKAQHRGDTTYTYVNPDIFSEDTPGQEIKNGFFWRSAVSVFANILRDNLNNKKEQQKIEYSRQQSIAKLGIIKNQYQSYKDFPAIIIDGWHNAVATDNINFCKTVKVLIKSNRVVKFVVDNCLPLNFNTTSEIKGAKNVVYLKNFNGEQLNIVELYFIYDIEEQVLVPEPIKPGYVCFWSDIKKFDQIQLRFEGSVLEKFTVQFDNTPDCFTQGMVCRILKPGYYSYVALGKGAIDWRGTFEIRENMCLKYRLGRRLRGREK